MLQKIIEAYVKEVVSDFIQEVTNEFLETHTIDEFEAVAEFIEIANKKLTKKMEVVKDGLQKI